MLRIYFMLVAVGLFLAPGNGQDTTLLIDQIYDLNLPANQHHNFTVTIPANQSQNHNLYISAYSTINDPYEEPIVKVTGHNFSLLCSSEESDLNDVCLIPAEQLQQQSTKSYNIQLYCSIDCSAKLILYLSQTVELDLGDEAVVSTGDTPLEKNFRIWIPEDEVFSEIQLTTETDNYEKVEGVSIYCNYGEKQNVVATERNHSLAIREDYGSLSSYYIYKKSGNGLEAGSYISITMMMGSNLKVKLVSGSFNNNTRVVEMNKILYDHSEDNREMLYIVDLSSIKGKEKKLIFVEVIQYSGAPDIEFSLSPSFSPAQTIKEANKSWIRFEITKQQQQAEAFGFKAYVKVKSRWASSYAVFSRANYKGFIVLQDRITQFVQIKPREVVEFLHSSIAPSSSNGSQSEMITREVVVDNPQHRPFHLAVFLCSKDQSSQNTNDNMSKLTKSCEIQKPDELLQSLLSNSSNSSNTPTVNNGFILQKLPTVSKQKSISFSYNSSQCLQFIGYNEDSLIKCEHVLLMYGEEGAQTVGEFEITFKSQEGQDVKLREGNSYRAEVDIGSYEYFVFKVPKKVQMKELTIFANVLDGSIAVLASRSVARPRLESSGEIKMGSNKVTFKDNEIVPGDIHIGVYGNSYSDFVINVIARRENVSSLPPNQIIVRNQDYFDQGFVEITDIELLEGQTTKYDLPIGAARINFKLIPTKIGQVHLKVSQLQGKVNVSFISFSQHSPSSEASCSNNICNITVPDLFTTYRVVIKAEMASRQEFTILYRESEGCYSYPLGTPLYAVLEPNETDCLIDSVNKTTPFEISNSLSSIEMMNKAIKMSVTFLDSNKTLLIPNNSFIVSRSVMAEGCPDDHKLCQFQLKYTAGNEKVVFQTVIQRVDGILDLYDGVSQIVNAELSDSKGKYFKYNVNQLLSAQIFLDSFSPSVYQIRASLISGLNETGDLANFPSANNTLAAWSFKTSTSSLSMMPISRSSLQTQISRQSLTQPVLLVSVFGTNATPSITSFSLEITQQQRVLKEGKSQVGFLEQGEVVSYELYPSKNSLLSVRSTSKDKCYTLLDENEQPASDSPFGDEVHIENAAAIPLYYYLSLKKGFTSCMYQISLQSFDDNILELSNNFPQQVTLEYSQATYFLYYHNRNQEFRVFEMIQSGQSTVYLTPLTPSIIDQSGLKDIENKIPLSSYLYKSSQTNFLSITPASNDYCFNCYYLIAVKAAPAVIEQLIIDIGDAPIVISDNSVIDSIAEKDQVDRYVYYVSAQNFKVNLGVVVGEGMVSVKIQSGPALVKDRGISSGLNEIEVEIGEGELAGDRRVKCVIEVNAATHLSYHFQVIPDSSILSISEGVPLIMELTQDSKTLQFYNLRDTGKLHIVVEALNNTFISSVGLSVSFSKSQHKNWDSVRPKYNRAGNVLEGQMDARRGYYQFVVINNLSKDTKAYVIIPKAGLSELIQGNKLLGKHEGIFEIYVPEDKYALVQLFECEGNIKLRGSAEYNQLVEANPGPGEVELLHKNIGGHYIIQTQGITGQYYIRVQSKDYIARIEQKVGQMQYLLRYRLLPDSQLNPYQLVDAQNFSINVIPSQNIIDLELSVNNLKAISPDTQVSDLKYFFTLGLDAEEVSKFMICSTDSNTKRVKYLTGVDPRSDTVTMDITKEMIVEKIGEQQSFAGVMGSVSIQTAGNQIDDIMFVYDPAEVKKYQKHYLTAFGLFEVVVIITMILGGIVLLYTLYYEAVKIYRGYQQDALNEQNEPQISGQESSENKFDISKEGQAEQSSIEN